MIDKNGLHSISGFWRNDKDDGIGIKFAGSPDHLAAIRDVIMAYDEPDDDATHTELLDQLTEFGQRRGKLSEDERLAALMVINLLERRGVIQANDFNGMLYAWITDDKLVFSPDAM